jgi:hypothetical protein
MLLAGFLLCCTTFWGLRTHGRSNPERGKSEIRYSRLPLAAGKGSSVRLLLGCRLYRTILSSSVRWGKWRFIRVSASHKSGTEVPQEPYSGHCSRAVPMVTNSRYPLGLSLAALKSFGRPCPLITFRTIFSRFVTNCPNNDGRPPLIQRPEMPIKSGVLTIHCPNKDPSWDRRQGQETLRAFPSVDRNSEGHPSLCIRPCREYAGACPGRAAELKFSCSETGTR